MELLGDSLDLQAALHDLTCIQCGRRLDVSEETRDRANIRAAGDERGRCMAQAVDIQVSGKIVRLQNLLEAPWEGLGVKGSVHLFQRNT